MSVSLSLMISGRRRHYRRIFPIVISAYMALSAVLIPLGFKLMAVLTAKSMLVSILSVFFSMMGVMKRVLAPTAYPYQSASAGAAAYPFSGFFPFRRRRSGTNDNVLRQEVNPFVDGYPTEFYHFTDDDTDSSL